MTYHEDGTAARKLLDALGLPLDTNVVEWHSEVLADPDPPTPVYVGVTTVDGPTTSVALPAGVVEGDLLVLVTSFWDGGTCSDPRMDLLHEFPGYTGGIFGRLWVGRATSSTSPLTVSIAGAAGRCSTILVALHDAEVVHGEYRSGSGGPGATATAPLVSSAEFALALAVSINGGFTIGTISRSGSYTDVGYMNGGSKTTAVASYWDPTDPATSPADTYTFSGQTDGYGLATLKIAAPDPASAGPPPMVWARDDDRTAALVEYAITHGRPSPLESVGPLTCSVALARELLTDALPTAGERFRITLSEEVGTALGVVEEEWPRFTGEITDAVVNAEGVLSIVQVTGVGRRARLGRVPVLMKRPAELDGKRVRRALYKAAVKLPLDLGKFDPGTVTLFAQDYTGGDSAQGIVDTVTASSLGQLVEHRSGRLDWHDAEHRRGVDPSVTLTGADHVIRPFQWAQTVATVVNDVEVTYGPADARGVARVTDTTSANVATGLGPYGAQIDTQLNEKPDAYALGAEIVGRYATPSWMLPGLAVDIVRTAADRAGAVLSLSHGDKITASGLPPDGPFDAGDLFVEGTTESFVRTAWRVSLAVADPTIAGVGIRWVDVAPLLQWDAVDPGIRWLDATVMEDSLGLGDPVLDGGTASSTDTSTVDGGTATSTDADTIDGGTP